MPAVRQKFHLSSCADSRDRLCGWAADTATAQPEVYRKITTLPQGRLYLAGDAWSYLPGWQEGAVTSVYAAVEAMVNRLTAGHLNSVR